MENTNLVVRGEIKKAPRPKVPKSHCIVDLDDSHDLSQVFDEFKLKKAKKVTRYHPIGGIQKLYDHKDIAVRLVACVLNSVVTEKKPVFFMSRRMMIELIKSDPNMKGRKTISGQEYKKFVAMAVNGDMRGRRYLDVVKPWFMLEKRVDYVDGLDRSSKMKEKIVDNQEFNFLGKKKIYDRRAAIFCVSETFSEITEYCYQNGQSEWGSEFKKSIETAVMIQKKTYLTESIQREYNCISEAVNEPNVPFLRAVTSHLSKSKYVSNKDTYTHFHAENNEKGRIEKLNQGKTAVRQSEGGIETTYAEESKIVLKAQVSKGKSDSLDSFANDKPNQYEKNQELVEKLSEGRVKENHFEASQCHPRAGVKATKFGRHGLGVGDEVREADDVVDHFLLEIRKSGMETKEQFRPFQARQINQAIEEIGVDGLKRVISHCVENWERLRDNDVIQGHKLLASPNLNQILAPWRYRILFGKVQSIEKKRNSSWSDTMMVKKKPSEMTESEKKRQRIFEEIKAKTITFENSKRSQMTSSEKREMDLESIRSKMIDLS